MRERVEHGEVGRTGHEQGVGRRPGRWADRWVRRWDGGRPAAGPRPVRPARALVLVRPLEVPRPVREAAPAEKADPRRARVWTEGAAGRPSGSRLLARPAVCAPGRTGAVASWRRVVTGIAVVAASAAVVVALGLLARVAEPGPAPASVSVSEPAPVVVTVEPGETVWDVAARVAPGRPGAEVAAVAERIVADNALRSVRPEPGQVLRVAGG